MNHDDNSIPLLTEVIPVIPQRTQPAPHATPATSATAAAPATLVWHDEAEPSSAAPDYGTSSLPGAFYQPPGSASYQAPAVPAAIQPEHPQPAAPSPEDWRQWEHDIRENVLHTLLTQADTVLQQHLQDQLAIALDNVADILTQRVKQSLEQALADTVSRAVAEEMAKFEFSKK